jgi:hypothetical protein
MGIELKEGYKKRINKWQDKIRREKQKDNEK